MVHKRWDAPYDFEGSAQLKDAMKRHLYKIKSGNEAIDSAHEMINRDRKKLGQLSELVRVGGFFLTLRSTLALKKVIFQLLLFQL